MRALVAGEINVDLILRNYQNFPELGKEVLVEDATLALGSSSAIAAVGLARLGNPVAYVGKVGCDSWGEFCLKALADEGIDIGRVIRDPKLRTGLTVSISGPRDRALVTHLGAIIALTAEDVTDDALCGFDHLHISSYFMQTGLRAGCASLFERASMQGLTTSLDPGFDPEEKWDRGLIDVLQYVDVFFPNELELAAISGHNDPGRALRSLQNGRTRVIAKLGAQGSMALDNDRLVRCPAARVEPVDTTGAGDSFNAGFLSCWRAGGSLAAAMRFAGACGALSTLANAGTGSQPTRNQAEAFLKNQRLELEVLE